MISGDPATPRLGVKVAFIWAATNVGCFLYVYFFIPELKGLELEEVDELYVPIGTLMVGLKQRFLLERVRPGNQQFRIARAVMNSRPLIRKTGRL
jgi:hypothetical protein